MSAPRPITARKSRATLDHPIADNPINATTIAKTGRGDHGMAFARQMDEIEGVVAQRNFVDFVADTLVSGRRFRILTLVDDFTGPTGYGLRRQITALGHECSVIAPSQIPRRPGEHVKTRVATH